MGGGVGQSVRMLSPWDPRTQGDAQMKPTNEEMRTHIAQLMIHGDWHGVTSRKLLAEEWGVAERTVGDRALEASRAIGLNRDIKGWVDEKIQQLESATRARRASTRRRRSARACARKR